MTTIQHISVKVCGNPASNSGFIPILLFNNPSFAIEDQFYVGFDNCSFFYTIRTTSKQTIYTLVKNNVRSYGATRAGSLIIAFSVPKNYTIEGGYTPYYILGKLKDEFLKKCMTCKDSIRETYEFNPGLIDQHVLDDVAKEFTLTPHPTPERVMNPSAPKGYIVKTDAEIEKLFHDINYPEFDNFSEVIVAEAAGQTSYIPINNIQIPRPKSYAIYVDDEFKLTCADLNQSLTVSSDKPTNYYENKTVHFTIQNLKDGDLLPGIELNEANETIHITTQEWATPKTRTIRLKIVPAEFEQYFFTNKHLLKLRSPFSSIQLDKNLSFTLEGEQIAGIEQGAIQLELAQNGKFTLSKQAINGNELRVTVKEMKQPIYPDNEHQQAARTEKSSPVYDIAILLYGRKTFEKSKSVDIKLKTDQMTLASCRTTFKLVPKSNDIFEGHFYVPKGLANRLLHISFCVNKKEYITKVPLSFSNNNTLELNEEKGHFKISPEKPFYKNSSFIIKVAILSAAILLAFATGYASHDGIKKISNFMKSKQNEKGTAVTDTTGVKEDTLMTKEEAEKFLRETDSILKTKSLKFDEVVSRFQTYFQNKDSIQEVDSVKFQKKVCNRINDYHTIVQYIKNGEVENIKTAMQGYPEKLHIWEQHAELVKKILNSKDSKNQFFNNYKLITCFDDIEKHITNDNSSEKESNTATPKENKASNTKSNKTSEKKVTAPTDKSKKER